MTGSWKTGGLRSNAATVSERTPTRVLRERHGETQQTGRFKIGRRMEIVYVSQRYNAHTPFLDWAVYLRIVVVVPLSCCDAQQHADVRISENTASIWLSKCYNL